MAMALAIGTVDIDMQPTNIKIQPQDYFASEKVTCTKSMLLDSV